MVAIERAKRDRQVERVLVREALANLAVMVAKAVVGFHTGSIAVIGDAVHSLADFANNIVAFIATRIASAPPDQDHAAPIYHRWWFWAAVGVATVAAVAIPMAISSGDSARPVIHEF